ncbi:MAG: hypothetical protein AAFV53_36670 [Myxococcota bacterium]
MRAAVLSLLVGWIGLGASTAYATPARIAALSNNGGFIDDTDFFRYPSALKAQPSRAALNYGGAFDGGLILDGDTKQAFFLQRHSVGGALPDLSLGGVGGFQALYGRASGSSGFLIRAAQNPNTPAFSIGGAWSNGPGKGNVQNLAIDGDLVIFNNLVDEDQDNDLGIRLGVTGRTLTSDRLTVWNARFSLDTLNEQAVLHGGYTLGPRFRNDDVRIAMQLGPVLNVIIPVGDNNAAPGLGFDIPFGNFAGEYLLREWFVIRGSLTAAWAATVSNLEEDAIDNLSFGPRLGGAFGVGFKHKQAQFDMTVNPTWVQNGPHVLSGVSNPMFAVLSARVDL